MKRPTTLRDYAAEVNRLARLKVDRLNAEHKAGKRLFGASHFDFPEKMVALYFNDGLTPADALKAIYAESAAERRAEARMS